MAVIDIEFLFLGLIFSLYKVAAEEICTYSCGYYTCYTTCDHGCCGTYDSRYCCSGYSSVATVVGASVGGLMILALIVGIVAFCVTAVQKKKRRVHPRRAQPVAQNNIIVNNRSHRNHRPNATAPPYNQTTRPIEVSSYNQNTQPTGAPPFIIGAPPPSYDEIYPQHASNNTPSHSNSGPSQQTSTNIQTSQQYGQLQIPSSPPPPY